MFPVTKSRDRNLNLDACLAVVVLSLLIYCILWRQGAVREAVDDVLLAYVWMMDFERAREKVKFVAEFLGQLCEV